MPWGTTSPDKRFREVNDSVGALLRFSEDRVAAFICSFGATGVSAYEFVATRGSLRADPAYEYTSPLKLTTKMEGKSRTKTFPKSDQFAPELIYFSDCILNNRDPEPSGREGMEDVRVILAVQRSIKIGEPERRPSPEQEMHRPPVSKPEMIHAQSPSH